MKDTIRINQNTLAAFIAFFAFNEPAYIQFYVKSIHYAYLGLQLSVVLWLLLMVLKRTKFKKISKCTIGFGVFFVQLCLSTLIANRSMLVGALWYCIPIMLFCLWMDSFDGKSIQHVLKGFYWVIILLCLLNFLSVLIFPNGLYQGMSSVEKYYFLGHNNSVIRIVLPGIVFSGAYDYLTKGKISLRTFCLTGLSMLTFIITWSNSAMIGCGVVLFFLLFLRKKSLGRLFNANNLFVMMIVFFLLVIIFGSGNRLLSTVAGIFGKTGDLSGRTTIWKYGLIAIKKKWVIGYGYGTPIVRIANWTINPYSYHNYMLDLMYRGGILQVVIQLIIIKMCCDQLVRRSTEFSRFLIVSLLSYFIMWQVLPFTNKDSWAMILVMCLCYRSVYLMDTACGRDS